MSGSNPGSVDNKIDTEQHDDKQKQPVVGDAQNSNVADDGISTQTDHTERTPPILVPPDNSTAAPPNQGRQIGLQTIELLKEISQKLSMTGRVDQSTRARFWDMYKAEAEEFHADFLKKYTGDLDNALIFAGLFCSVDATFAVQMQPNLGPDPNITTQALLMMVVHALNSTALGDQVLTLPLFDGPSRLTIWVQSLLYASLAASLFAALGAMLGKQWLSHYATVGEKGTTEQRCVDRQLKSVGLQTWHFHAVLACIPLLLQASLFLFIVGMAGYLWDQQRSLSAVMIAAGIAVVVFYAFTVVSSLFYSDCPFYTPISEAIVIVSRRISAWVLHCRHHANQQWGLFRFPVKPTGSRPSSRMQLLPTQVRIVHPEPVLSDGMGYEMHQLPKIMDMAMGINGPRYSLLKPNHRLELSPEAPELANKLEDIRMDRGVDASCVSWLLVTSTHPDVVTTTARMVLEVSWAHALQVDPLPMLSQLRDAFTSCFVFKRLSGRFFLLPHCGDRALACGQAILHVCFQRGYLGQTPDMGGTTADTEKLLMEAKDLYWHNDVSLDNPDLYFIIQGLRVLADPSYLFSTTRESQVELITTDRLDEWISDHALLCLSNANTPDRLRLYMLDVLCAWFRRCVDVSHKHLYHKYFLAGACGLGYQPTPEELLRPNVNQNHVEETLKTMLSHLTRAILSHLNPNIGLDRLHVTFAWELMGPLADLMENGLFLETFYTQKLHHTAIRLCRATLQEEAIEEHKPPRYMRQTFPTRKVWSWVEDWLRISVMAGYPHGHGRQGLSDEGLRTLRMVWRCHYSDLDRDFLAQDDLIWLAFVVEKASDLIRQGQSIEGSHLPQIVAYCLILLCEVPDIATSSDLTNIAINISAHVLASTSTRISTRISASIPARISASISTGISTGLSLAMRSSGILGQAGLKMFRTTCGPGQDITHGPLHSRETSFSRFWEISQSLSQLATTFYQTDGTNARKPESYLFHLAYLDFARELLYYYNDFSRKHVGNCLELASSLVMAPRSEGWFEEEESMVRTCLGREAEYRPWKNLSPKVDMRGNWDGSLGFPNTYVRDVLYRIVQVFARFVQVHSAPHLIDCKPVHTTLEIIFTSACACWYIYDTHPLPDDSLLSMSKLMQEILSCWPDARSSPIGRSQLITPVFRYICERIGVVPVWYRHSKVLENTAPWFSALRILRPHIVINDDTFVTPWPQDSYFMRVVQAYDRKNKDNDRKENQIAPVEDSFESMKGIDSEAHGQDDNLGNTIN